MREPGLNLAAQSSGEALHAALVECGREGTRTPTDSKPCDPSDERELLGATAHGRSVTTFSVRDCTALAKQYPRYGGIMLAAQSSWALSQLITALDRPLSEAQAEALAGQVRWLNEWP